MRASSNAHIQASAIALPLTRLSAPNPSPLPDNPDAALASLSLRTKAPVPRLLGVEEASIAEKSARSLGDICSCEELAWLAAEAVCRETCELWGEPSWKSACSASRSASAVCVSVRIVGGLRGWWVLLTGVRGGDMIVAVVDCDCEGVWRWRDCRGVESMSAGGWRRGA